MQTLASLFRIPFRFPVALLLVVLLVFGGTACRQNRDSETAAQGDGTSQIENDLTFTNITLEQADEQGRKLWVVKAEQATYSQDKQLAEVLNPKGELFEAGQPIYQIQGQKGRVQQNGEQISLLGQIIATDLRSGAVLQGDELRWTPKDGLLVVRHNLRGTHPQVNASAQEARLYQQDRRLELLGGVTATTKGEQIVQLQAETLTWLLDNGQIRSDRPVKFTRLINGAPTDTATGDRGEFFLKTKIATLSANARVNLVNPPLQISSNLLTWNVPQQTLKADQPVTLVERQQQITLTASRGRLDLKTNTAYLDGNVRATGQRNNAQLTANALTYNLSSRQMQAEGQVTYRQSNPAFTVTGPRAVGNLATQQVTVSGGNVLTEIMPQAGR
ncbi:MAG TPA: LPS export ABC transporter periplasmic protein LptC [Synechococcales cyanobacterium M55_K2018_004]|nr:LPS export ABC transporter periplasmic protein LptC [Synechococcales cyanobacterium M55_K2018_004]